MIHHKITRDEHFGLWIGIAAIAFLFVMLTPALVFVEGIPLIECVLIAAGVMLLYAVGWLLFIMTKPSN